MLNKIKKIFSRNKIKENYYIEKKKKDRSKLRLHITYWLIIINILLWGLAVYKIKNFYIDITSLAWAADIDVSILQDRKSVSSKPSQAGTRPSIGRAVGQNIIPLGMAAAVSRVCKEKELDYRWCRNDLLAIAFVESRFNCKVIGKFKEKGCFQIMPYHNWKAGDFENDAKWTLDRLIRYGYPKFRTRALQCHNGCGVKNGYAQKIKRYSDYFDKIL